MILYAATSNPGKLHEFASAAQPAGIVVLALPGLATMPEPVEDASTFMGNAELKAIAYSNLAPGLLVFADDSGLEATALGGQPGVRSARYADDLGFELPQTPVFSTQFPTLITSTGAPPTSAISPEAQRSGETPVFAPAHPKGAAKDDRNNRALLSQLAFHIDRSARFACTLALARNGKILLRAEGTVAGEILTAPRGEDGFGYDPLFFIPSLGLTLAELTREQKWKISHRGHAFRSLLAQLQQSDIAQ